MDSQNLIERTKIISSPTRMKILELLKEKKQPMTITEIKNELSDYDYRGIWQHIKILESGSLIKTHKEIHRKGKPVIIDLTDLALDVIKLAVLLNKK